jgi:hypothetical protein
MRAVQVNCGRWLPQSDWDRFATSNSAAQCYIESPRNNDIFSFAVSSVPSCFLQARFQSSPIKPNRAIFMPPPSKICGKVRDLQPQPVVPGAITGKDTCIKFSPKIKANQA